MYLYVQDNGHSGCVVVIAHNEAEAREKMSDVYSYDRNEPVEEHEISSDFKFYCLGDS